MAKKTTKKTATRKTAGRKRSAGAASDENAETATTAPDAVAAEAAPAKRKPAARRKKAAADETSAATETVTATAPRGRKSRTAAVPADEVQVEEAGGVVVVRFPPVAPSPFAEPPPGVVIERTAPAARAPLPAPPETFRPRPIEVPVREADSRSRDRSDVAEHRRSEAGRERTSGERGRAESDESRTSPPRAADRHADSEIDESSPLEINAPSEVEPDGLRPVAREEGEREGRRRRRRGGRGRRGRGGDGFQRDAAAMDRGDRGERGDRRERDERGGPPAPRYPETPAARDDDRARDEPAYEDERRALDQRDADRRPVEARDDGDQQPLSASQKRRLRRRRRQQPGDFLPPPGPEREAHPPRDLEDQEESAAQAELDDEREVEEFEENGRSPDEVLDVDLEGEVALIERDDEEGEDVVPDRGRRGRRFRDRRHRRDREEQQEYAPTVVEPEAEEETRAGTREMIINVVPREECRIAILHRDRLEEIYLERASAENYVGNIYKGVITNVEPSIQAAFVDFGMGKNGFLHISDLGPQYFPNGGHAENVGRKLPRRHRPPIQKCLRRGQELLVQITKEGMGTKGPTLSTYLSIPGRFMVMMPGMRRLGVSRKIEDEDTRQKLRGAMSKLELPEDIGFIARTAAAGRTQKELQSDLDYLTRLWRAVERRIKSERAPAELYRESDLVIRTIRDVFTPDIARIIVDDVDMAERAREFLEIFNPTFRDKVVIYNDSQPIFHKYGIEAELEKLHSRHVPLRIGGSLVIDQTEALVAIDVNSGKFRTEDDAENTAYKINLEAADEIPRQLRLRDLGGVIVCDFIDMRMESHRREIERRLINNLKQHKERAKVLRMSAFGIIEMTRQRQRASLQRSVYQDCFHCRGTGLVKTAESVALDVMRLIQLAATREQIAYIEAIVSPEVAFMLQNRKRATLHKLETQHRRSISIRPDPKFSLDQVEIRCTDGRGRLVPHA